MNVWGSERLRDRDIDLNRIMNINVTACARTPRTIVLYFSSTFHLYLFTTNYVSTSSPTYKSNIMCFRLLFFFCVWGHAYEVFFSSSRNTSKTQTKRIDWLCVLMVLALLLFVVRLGDHRSVMMWWCSLFVCLCAYSTAHNAHRHWLGFVVVPAANTETQHKYIYIKNYLCMLCVQQSRTEHVRARIMLREAEHELCTAIDKPSSFLLL